MSEALQNGTLILGVPRADQLLTRVVLEADDLEQLTDVRTTDCRTALARGLAEYLGGQTVVWEGGRRSAFRFAEAVWAEPEVIAGSPSLIIIASTPGAYDDSELVPSLQAVADGRFVLRRVCEFVQTFQVSVWTNDPAERVALVALLEDALNPVEFMSGCRLELPFYFNARATYLPRSVSYSDQPGDASRRWRVAALEVASSVYQYRPINEPPGMIPELQLQVS